jgi:hypothetical protein
MTEKINVYFGTDSAGTLVNGIDARKDGKCTGNLIASDVAKCE